MWSGAGLLRHASTLNQCMAEIEAVATALERFRQQNKGGRLLYEARSLVTVARSIVASALARTESRGAHYRNDFPQREDDGKHSVYREGRAAFEAW
jgi:succinate dehydrogenase/fumarate reductase flavoprotein subunit